MEADLLKDKYHLTPGKAKTIVYDDFGEPVHPHYRCCGVLRVCTFIDTWKRLECVWSEEDNEWERSCWMCVKEREGLASEAEARHWIISHAPCFERKNKVWTQYKTAISLGSAFFPTLSSKKKRFQVTMDMMKDLWSEMETVLIKKAQHMKLLESKFDHHMELANRLKSAKTGAEARTLLEEVEQIFQQDEYLAFAKHGKETQARFMMASSYSDEWVRKGASYLRMWYICQRRTDTHEWEGSQNARCLHLTTSKNWERFKEDPLAAGQSYQCACYAGYKTFSGVIIEMHIVGVGRCYCRAPVPDWHVEDARAMLYEEKYQPMTPEELYEKEPVCRPTLGDIIVESPYYKGWWKVVDGATLDSLPEFNWFRIFAIFGAELKPAPLGKKAKRTANRQWWAEQEAAASQAASQAASSSG